jgi:hypothetical protein
MEQKGKDMKDDITHDSWLFKQLQDAAFAAEL